MMGVPDQIKGGHNKEIIMLNIARFKKFCLKAGTKKADEIHEYYIKLEETLHEGGAWGKHGIADVVWLIALSCDWLRCRVTDCVVAWLMACDPSVHKRFLNNNEINK